MQLRGKAFVITGASRGIGKALAEMLVQNGARVALSGRDKKRLGAVASTLKDLGGEVISVPGDVGSDADSGRLADAAWKAFGAIDVLVNNAAILAERAPVTATSPKVWEKVLRANVIGTANMIRHLLPRMERRGEGAIINLSSGWGREASGFVASYCASKFAVEALTQSVSEESRSGVIIFALNPGIIATDMLTTAFGSEASAYPEPGSLAPRWKKLFARLAPSWHGSSRDLMDY
jgi:NAD(P)-dependent dehydrogenase (short-subunit alcohol dehydrogenase family)